ncbi:MAG: SDR family NAD(P)-dependent oxidoreductase [Boseongicola sp.]|nr:SDR family NAD(P)-dependent oxidoreductase [Boseongicola sp.]MDD9979129.1 SDR family NAD(P)-dependent oxidoreductase [Boseongicola sp.]
MAEMNETSRPFAVIAGATGNVGRATATALAQRGFRVVMLGRNQERLEDRARSIEADLREANPDFTGELIPVQIDLTDLASIERAVDEIGRLSPVTDVLVLSAVTITQDGPTILPDGNEFMFSVNVLGQYRLAELLRPSVEAAQGIIAHVVAPFHRDIDWDDLQSNRNHKSMVAYERSKTCHRSIAGEMARRSDGGYTSFAFDPGFVIDKKDPDLAKRWPKGLMGLIWKLYAAVAAAPPAVAGEALADLVTDPSYRDHLNGAYYTQLRRREKSEPAMIDIAFGARLWTELDALAFPDTANEDANLSAGP